MKTLNLKKLFLYVIFAALFSPHTITDAHANEPSLTDDAPTGEMLDASDDQVAPKDTLSVSVTVAHQSGDMTGTSLEGIPVVLHAIRAMGPFETTRPEPAFQYAAITDATGIAHFNNLPQSILTQGLRLQAFATYENIPFASDTRVPSMTGTTQLALQVYDTGFETSAIELSNLRMVVEVWEDYLVFTQFWSLDIAADFALDTSLLPGAEFERGIPLRLPLKAQGIHASGPGETHIVNNFVYWKGVLIPEQPVTVQIRFSIPVNTPEYIYEHDLQYSARNVEVIMPLQTQFPKVPRLNNLQLAAPGFDVGTQHDLAGLRPDMEFLVASGATISSGDSIRFRLQGLPFERAIAPWFFLAFGLIAAIFIILFGRREKQRMLSQAGINEQLRILNAESSRLLDELAAVEHQYNNREMSEFEYEHIATLLRERIALIMNKIKELKAVHHGA